MSFTQRLVAKWAKVELLDLSKLLHYTYLSLFAKAEGWQQKRPLSSSCRAQLNTLAYPLFQLSMLCYIELHWLLYIILTYNVTVFHGVSGSLLAPCRLYITIAFLDDLLSCCVVALNLRINYGYKRDIFMVLYARSYMYVTIFMFSLLYSWQSFITLGSDSHICDIWNSAQYSSFILRIISELCLLLEFPTWVALL